MIRTSITGLQYRDWWTQAQTHQGATVWAPRECWHLDSSTAHELNPVAHETPELTDEYGIAGILRCSTCGITVGEYDSDGQSI